MGDGLAGVPWRVREVAFTLVIAAAAAAVLLLGVQGVAIARNEAEATAPLWLITTTTAFFYATLLGAVWLVVLRRYHVPWAALGLRAPEHRGSPLATLLLYALFFIGLAAIIVVFAAAANAVGLVPRLRLSNGLSGQSGSLVVLSLVVVLAIAPVAEEVLFRGVLYQVLRRRFGQRPAIGLSALTFAVVQLGTGSLQLYVAYLFLGVILAVSFEQTRSLYPAIGLHALYNLAIIILGASMA